MIEFWMTFLRELERLMPPPAKCHHCICYARYGSDADGWTDKLVVQVNDGGIFTAYFLDGNDGTDGPEALAADLHGLHLTRSANTQYGAAPGQFLPSKAQTT